MGSLEIRNRLFNGVLHPFILGLFELRRERPTSQTLSQGYKIAAHVLIELGRISFALQLFDQLKKFFLLHHMNTIRAWLRLRQSSIAMPDV